MTDLRAVDLGAELDLAKRRRDPGDVADGERLLALPNTSHTIVLERMRAGSAGRVPGDSELVLSADVQSFPLADLLSLLHAAGKSGLLTFSKGPVEKSISLRGGEVVFASSNQLCDRLGACLMQAGLITLAALREAERRWSPTERFGRILVENGSLTARDLWYGVKDHVEVIVRSLFAYPDGFVHFWEGEVEPDDVVKLCLSTRGLIAEGLEQRDELLRFVAHLEDPGVTLSTVAGVRDDLPGNGRAVYDAIETCEGFPAVCRRAGLDPVSTARTVHLLELLGAVEICRAPNPQALPVGGGQRAGDDDRLRRLVLDHVQLMAELVAPIVMIEGHGAVHDRLSRVLRDIGASHPGLLRGVELARGCVLDPDVITSRALRLAGSRETAVAAALGELVSYVEFELEHHPGIEDAGAFLDAVSDLRARVGRSDADCGEHG